MYKIAGRIHFHERKAKLLSYSEMLITQLCKCLLIPNAGLNVAL